MLTIHPQVHVVLMMLGQAMCAESVVLNLLTIHPGVVMVPKFGFATSDGQSVLMKVMALIDYSVLYKETSVELFVFM